MKALALALAGAALLAAPALSQGTPTTLARLMAAKSIRCVWGDGVHVDWDSGKPKVSPRAFASGADAVLQLDSIDHAKGSARVIGNQASSDALIQDTPAGLHFLEMTGNGGLVTITIYKQMVGDLFIGAYSRHIELLGHARPSHYTGLCKPWD